MIDLRLDEDQQMIRETIASFAREVVRPMAREADETGIVPARLLDQTWELGLMPASIPEAYGGHGQSQSAVTGTVVAEALAQGDLAVAAHALSPRLVIDPVLLLGSEEQKKRLLPTYCGRRFVPGSAAVLEPHWDFSVRKMRTTAQKTSDGYVLNGDKCLVPLAKDAPYTIVYARCEDDVVGAFLMPAGTSGAAIGEREKNLGLHGLETYGVSFSNCRLPMAARLGDDAMPLLRRARVAQSAMAIGVAAGALDYAIEYAKEREVFGVKVAQKQAIAFMLADMATEIDAARLLNWEAAWLLDAGKSAEREVAMAHRYAADMVMMVTDNGIQVLGGHGFVRDHPAEMWARNGRGFAMFEGLGSV
jgi:alkylation response protein AidB-like acyl-CoA dehydrogenase